MRFTKNKNMTRISHQRKIDCTLKRVKCKLFDQTRSFQYPDFPYFGSTLLTPMLPVYQ